LIANAFSRERPAEIAARALSSYACCVRGTSRLPARRFPRPSPARGLRT